MSSYGCYCRPGYFCAQCRLTRMSDISPVLEVRNHFSMRDMKKYQLKNKAKKK